MKYSIKTTTLALCLTAATSTQYASAMEFVLSAKAPVTATTIIQENKNKSKLTPQNIFNTDTELNDLFQNTSNTEGYINEEEEEEIQVAIALAESIDVITLNRDDSDNTYNTHQTKPSLFLNCQNHQYLPGHNSRNSITKGETTVAASLMRKNSLLEKTSEKPSFISSSPLSMSNQRSAFTEVRKEVDISQTIKMYTDLLHKKSKYEILIEREKRSESQLPGFNVDFKQKINTIAALSACNQDNLGHISQLIDNQKNKIYAMDTQSQIALNDLEKNQSILSELDNEYTKKQLELQYTLDVIEDSNQKKNRLSNTSVVDVQLLNSDCSNSVDGNDSENENENENSSDGSNSVDGNDSENENSSDGSNSVDGNDSENENENENSIDSNDEPVHYSQLAVNASDIIRNVDTDITKLHSQTRDEPFQVNQESLDAADSLEQSENTLRQLLISIQSIQSVAQQQTLKIQALEQEQLNEKEKLKVLTVDKKELILEAKQMLQDSQKIQTDWTTYLLAKKLIDSKIKIYQEELNHIQQEIQNTESLLQFNNNNR